MFPILSFSIKFEKKKSSTLFYSQENKEIKTLSFLLFLFFNS